MTSQVLLRLHSMFCLVGRSVLWLASSQNWCKYFTLLPVDILLHHLYILVHVGGRHDAAGHIRVLVHHIHTVLLARAAGASCADITRKLYIVTNTG